MGNMLLHINISHFYFWINPKRAKRNIKTIRKNKKISNLCSISSFILNSKY